MPNSPSFTIWQSETDYVRATAQAFQISRRLRYSLDSLHRTSTLQHISASEAPTILEVRDFSAVYDHVSHAAVDQFFLRNRTSMISLAGNRVIEHCEGSAIRYRLTDKGKALAAAVQPIVEEVIAFA